MNTSKILLMSAAFLFSFSAQSQTLSPDLLAQCESYRKKPAQLIETLDHIPTHLLKASFRRLGELHKEAKDLSVYSEHWEFNVFQMQGGLRKLEVSLTLKAIGANTKSQKESFIVVHSGKDNPGFGTFACDVQKVERQTPKSGSGSDLPTGGVR